MNKDNEQQAFPTMNLKGMTLRDWFAGQALIAINATGDIGKPAAVWAYQIADAMMKERDNDSTTI